MGAEWAWSCSWLREGCRAHESCGWRLSKKSHLVHISVQEKEQGSSACGSPGSLSATLAPEFGVCQELCACSPGSCWLLGAVQGGQLQGTGLQPGTHMSWGRGELCLKQPLQPTLTAPRGMEEPGWKQRGAVRCGGMFPSCSWKRRVLCGERHWAKSCWETQEDVFLVKEKYTGVFPLVTQCSLIMEWTFFSLFPHVASSWCSYISLPCGVPTLVDSPSEENLGQKLEPVFSIQHKYLGYGSIFSPTLCLNTVQLMYDCFFTDKISHRPICVEFYLLCVGSDVIA